MGEITQYMIDGLKDQYPGVPVDVLASQVSTMPGVTSPSGLLRFMCKEESSKSRKAQDKPVARGGFNADGSWSDRHHELGSNALTDLVYRLVESRRRPDRRYSPRDFADRITEARGWAISETGAFKPKTISAWMELSEFEDWSVAPAQTSAEAAVRDAGYGPKGYEVVEGSHRKDEGPDMSRSAFAKLQEGHDSPALETPFKIPVEKFRCWETDPKLRFQHVIVRNGFVYRSATDADRDSV